MTNEQRRELIEELIDNNSMDTILDDLAIICRDKAAHIEANWQDDNLVECWEKQGTKFGLMPLYV